MRFSKTTRRSLAAVAFASSVALMAAGCSAGSLGSSGDDGSSPGAVTITFNSGSTDAEVASAKAVADAFMAATPGVTVKLDNHPGGSEGDNYIKTRLATGDMSEVFSYNNGSLLQALKPEQNLVALDDQPWVSQVEPLFADSSKGADGKLYGAPYGTAFGGGVLYNIPVYKKLGLSVPTTWDEFMANSKKIKDAGGVDPVEQTYGETWTSQLFVLGDYANVEAQVPDFATKYTANQAGYANTPAALAGFQHIQQVKEAGLLNKDYASAKLNDGMKAVATGKAAQYPQLGGSASNIENVAPGKTGDVGIFALPGQDSTKNALTVWPGTSALYIAKTAEGDKLEAAKKFLAFASTQQGCDANITGAPPQGPFLTKACQLPSDVSQVAKDTQKYFADGKIVPALEFKSPIKGPNLEQICIQVGTGQETAEKAAALYDKDVKKQAQQLGLPGWD